MSRAGSVARSSSAMRRQYQAAAVARDVAGAQLLGPAHLRALDHVEAGARVGEVGAGAERAPATGDHDGADGVVVVDEVPHLQELALHRRVERVELLEPVEGDRRDRVGDLVGDRRERHPRESPQRRSAP
jgi:hypothetical protein